MNERKYNVKARTEGAPTTTVVPLTPEVKNSDAVEGALKLFEYLPEDIRRDIKEAADAMQLPLWQMLLGYVVRCWDGKLLYAPFLLSSWENGVKPSSTHRCESCGHMFYSRFPDARYCCNRCAFGKLDDGGHSDGCAITDQE